MNVRRFGQTSLEVSELCLGTLNLGQKTDEATAFAILDAFRAAGGNFFQAKGISTAWGFSDALPSLSEEIVGQWWRSRGIARDQIVLATRISLSRPANGNVAAFHSVVRESVEASLRRLQTSHLDLLVCEWNEGLLPIEDTLDVFDILVRAGLVRYVASANFPVWRVLDAISRSRVGYQNRIEGLQADYSLITRSGFEGEAHELCREYHLGFIARAPLAGGFLIKRDAASLLLNSTRRRWLNQRYANGYGESVFTAISEVAAVCGMSPAQIGLAWVLDNTDVTSALIGVVSTEQLDELIGATKFSLSFRERARLCEVTALEGLRV